MDESLSSVSQASVTPEYVYDQSIEAVAVLPALSPQLALPTERPLSALPIVSATQSPPESDYRLDEGPLEHPLKRHAVLQA